MGNGNVDAQIDLIVELLLFAHVAPEPTPIFDDILAAQQAGFDREYHPHWRMELDHRADAYAEAEAAFYGDDRW